MYELDRNYSTHSATAKLMIMFGIIIFFVGFVIHLFMGLDWATISNYLPVWPIAITFVIMVSIPLVIVFLVWPLTKMASARSYSEPTRLGAICPVCGRPVPIDAVYCPYCGERISPSEDRSY
ncbi:MAG: zinc ribbon domain-containing protein [Candidatus Thorarchaeota archaeon]|nr:zinc ribbon domain-containing protein [Candidatus Thorarchaeota archaeon]